VEYSEAGQTLAQQSGSSKSSAKKTSDSNNNRKKSVETYRSRRRHVNVHASVVALGCCCLGLGLTPRKALQLLEP